MHRRLLLAVIVVPLVAACAGDPEPAGSPTATAPVPAAEAPSPGPSPSPSPTEDVTVVTVAVADGEVEGGIARPAVELGSVVRFEVTTDTADHVHVHGYDLVEDVEPSGTAVLEFTADIPGKFEVELEDSQLQIAELTVQG